jgi:hypothetical protein
MQGNPVGNRACCGDDRGDILWKSGAYMRVPVAAAAWWRSAMRIAATASPHHPSSPGLTGRSGAPFAPVWQQRSPTNSAGVTGLPSKSDVSDFDHLYVPMWGNDIAEGGR